MSSCSKKWCRGVVIFHPKTESRKNGPLKISPPDFPLAMARPWRPWRFGATKGDLRGGQVDQQLLDVIETLPKNPPAIDLQ